MTSTRRSNIVRAVLFVLACCGCWAQTPSSVPDQNIRIDVNLVTLRFTVKDSSGRPANDLAQQQFSVFQGGVLQEAVFFDSPRNTTGAMKRLQLAFLLDISGSTLATRSEEIAAAETFLRNVHGFTRVGVFGFTDELVSFQGFTSDRRLALKALASTQQHLGKTAIYGSLSALIRQFDNAGKPEIQNVVIVISDAMDDAYRRSTQTIALADTNNIVVYTILVPSAAQLYIRPASAAETPASDRLSQDRKAKEAAFARLALQTGGKHFSGFETILNFNQVMAQINDDIFGNLYSLGYYTLDSDTDKRERDVRIQARRSDLSISTPFENLPERLTAKKQLITALFDNNAVTTLPENLHSVFRELGAEVNLLRTRREGGQIGLPFRIKISPYNLRRSEKGDIKTQLGIIGLLLDQQGNEVVRLREIFQVNLDDKDMREGRGIIYTNKLFAAPGTYRLKIALLELTSWKMAAFEYVVRIVDQ